MQQIDDAQTHEQKPEIPDVVRAHMATIGKKGAKATMERYGKAHYSRIGKISAKKRQKKTKLLDEVAKLITG